MAILICPVRHHSPAAALQVARLIRERRPRAVLVEGPADGTDLIPLLLDGETAPPVALYAYRATPEGSGRGADGRSGETGETAGAGAAGTQEVRAVYYPFCEYSPEYVALRTGQEVGADLRFCDVPAATVLARPAVPPGERPGERPAESGPGPGAGEDPLPPTALPGFGDFAAAVAEAGGYGSFEEFWEAVFEQAAGAAPPETALSWLETFGRQARQLGDASLELENGVRERHMAGAARALVDEGLPPESLLLVCGAAHAGPIAAAFAAGDGPHGADPVATPMDVEEEETRLALIPYSYPRLSEQLGYGAGNRAPWYYQEVWRRQGDFGVATQRALLALAARLRREGQSASLAQCIDAYNLACVLAGMRRKGAPGADELREAAVSCFGQGQPAPVAAAVTQVLIGDAVGRITPRVGRTPLQVEFYATAQHLRLPLQDVPRQVLLHLVVPREAEGSVFLHRLALAGVPFAHPLESGLGRLGRGAAPAGGSGAGAGQPLQQLGLVREKWELQWTPATDARLIERTAWGSRLADVCVRLLGAQLAGAGRIDAGTTVLLQAALCDVLEGLPGAIERCEALAADSASFPPLARATYHLDGLLTYGAARRLPAARLGALAARLFARAALHLPEAAACGDEDAAQIQAALLPLHDLVRRGSPAAGVEPWGPRPTRASPGPPPVHSVPEGTPEGVEPGAPAEVEGAWGPQPGRASAASDRGRGAEQRPTSSGVQHASESGRGEAAPAFWSAVEAVAERPASHPTLRGLALVLLELDGRLEPEALAGRLRYWLSRGADAAGNARLIAGLFALHRGTLVRQRTLIGAVTDFLVGLDLPQLTPLLPVLRRSLGALSPGERAYLTETLAAHLGVGASAAGRVLRLASSESARLGAADQEVGAVLAGWEERYGLA